MSKHFLRTPGAMTMMSFVALFAGLVLWASFAVLDYGVHAEGVVASLNPNVAIQHKEAVRAAKVHVVEGEHVKRGQPLLTLDDADALADAHRTLAQQLSIRLQFEALKAERNGSSVLPTPRWDNTLLSGAFVRQVVRDAEVALQQRIQAHQAQLATFASEQQSGKAVLVQLQAGLDAVEAQSEMVTRQLKDMEPLVAEKLVARTMVDDQKNRLDELKKARANILAERERTLGMIEQSGTRQQGYVTNRGNELDKGIAELALQLEGSEKMTSAAKVRLGSYDITAPVNGQVVNLKVTASGEIVRPGDVIMEIVPDEKRFFIDAKVTPAEIEAVQTVGQHALIRFVTLPSKSTPKVDGRLLSIASSATMDERTGQRFYIARVEFTGDVEKILGTPITLGMPVSVLLKGGKRSVMSYLVDPFKVLFMRALREE